MDPRALSDDALHEWIDREVVRPLGDVGVHVHSIGNVNGLPPDRRREWASGGREFCLRAVRSGFPRLRRAFGTAARRNVVCSYRLKHVLEDTMPERYISNGDCILAVLMHGGAVDFSGVAGVNAVLHAPGPTLGEALGPESWWQT
jgi:hypothetical protein